MKITITAVIGGPDAEGSVDPALFSLRKKLKSLAERTHSEDLDGIRLRVHVSGKITKYREPNGCSGFRVAKKSRYASAELTMHQDVWRKGEQHVEAYLGQLAFEAVSELTRRCEKAGVRIDSELLLSDLQSASAIAGTLREG